VAGDETGIGDGGKSDGDGDKVGGQATASRIGMHNTNPNEGNVIPLLW
jgi:hypothetical protein